MIRTVVHPQRGPWEFIAPPIHLSESDVEMEPAPMLGQHTAEVLEEVLGLDAAELERYAASGVIGILDGVPEPAPASV